LHGGDHALANGVYVLKGDGLRTSRERAIDVTRPHVEADSLASLRTHVS
jgi:hypothetical protein